MTIKWPVNFSNYWLEKLRGQILWCISYFTISVSLLSFAARHHGNTRFFRV